jgi:hypothetical protein
MAKGRTIAVLWMKIGYDLALLRMFQHTKPPEEIR